MRGRIVLGALLLTVAVSWGLSLNGITLFPGGFAVWWPSLFVLLGLVMLLPPTRPVAAAVLMAAGALLQAWRLDLVPGWSYAGPVALGLLGFALIVGAGRRARWHRGG